MNYGEIKLCDIANGEGVRVSLFVSGCTHHCKTIWCYSGYLFDKELLSDSRARCECTDEMLSMIDVLVDGEFVEALHDISLAFRGSSNQRIIDVKASLKENKIIPHKLMKRGV